MQLSRVAVSCVVLAVAAAVVGVAARTELHEVVAADLSEPTWMSAEYADSESANKPLTAEQRFRQELYLELHPERVVKPEAVKIRFLQDGVTLDQAQAQGADAEAEADAEADTQADAEAEAETETESHAEGEAEAEAEAESEGESESNAEADAESEEAAASMRPLDNAEAEEEAADARYRMDSVLHADMPLPVPLPNANAAHTQVAATMDAARFAQVSAMAAANTAAHQQQQAQALGGATAQSQALMWSAEKQAALDAFLEADDMDEEDLDADEDEDEADDEAEDADQESGEQQMLEMRAEHAVHERTRFGRGAAARMGMADYERRAQDEAQQMGGAREYDSDAEDVSDLMAAQEEVDAHAGVARAPGHEHDQFGGNVRFARVHAPLPEDKDSRLYYARSRRGEKIRRMIKRGEMLYRYAPELMSKVFDPARKVAKPGVSPTFGQAMDGPLGPITPPPLGGAAKPKAGSVGPAFFQMNAHAHVQHQQHAEAEAAAEAAAAARDDGDEGESGGGASKPAKGAKGSKEWIAKKMAEIDTLIKNPYAQAEKYPQMYQHWDNYMYPLRNRPLPPRFYPYPQKGRNPISAFPPAAALFESPPPQRGPLQTPNALFQNPRGVGGLQPLPAPFASIGQPSAPSPYASPLGLARFPGGGVPQGADAANNGVLGPKNHPVFSAHPLPLQKWYQKFLQPAEAPAMTKAPGAKDGDAEAGSGGASGGEGDS